MRPPVSLALISLAFAASCAMPATHEVRTSTDVVREFLAEDALKMADEHFQAARYAEAIPHYREALELDPEQGVAWFRLGYALHATGDLSAAVVAHERATNYQPWAPIAAYNKGCALALLGDPDAAFEALERARELGFNNLAQLDGDADLESLRDDPRFAALRGSMGAPSTAAAPSEVLRQLDFWVGDWVVTTASGQTLGTNTITNQLGGHMIFEEWTGSTGGTGKSINYYDRDAEQWKQVWVSAGGNVLQMAGTFTDGAMRFVGETMYASGKTVDHRTTLTPLSDGRVRQFIEESSDGGATWRNTFDGYYAPKER